MNHDGQKPPVSAAVKGKKVQCIGRTAEYTLAKPVLRFCGIGYMDLSCYIEVTGKMCPPDFASYAPVFYQPIGREYPERGIIDQDRISVAWLGRLDADKIESVINMADRLYENEADSRLIDVHLIGDGAARDRIDVEKYAPRITFHFPSYLYGEELCDYLHKNADFAVAMGISALDIARVKVPVVLPIVSVEPIACNKFVWLYDTKDYTLGVTEAFIDRAGVTCHTMEEVLRAVYAENGRQALGAKCRVYAEEAFSIAHSTKCLLRAMDASTLTAKQLADTPVLKAEMAKWRLHKRLMPRRNILQHIDFLHQEQAAAEGGCQSRTLFVPKKVIKKVGKRLLGAVKRRYLAWKRIHSYETAIRHYDRVLPELKKKLAREGRLKTGFVVLFSSTFTYRPIFEAMMQSKEFDPYVIVVPDVSRSPEFRAEQFTRAYEELSEKYPGRVVRGYDPETSSHTDIGETYSVLFFANPYGHMVAPEYQIRHFWKKNVLMLYAYYGFGAVNYGRQVMQTDVYNSVWKLLLDTELSLQDLKTYQPVKGLNGIVTGYVKMDELAQIPVETNRRKRILVCPHHTVMNWSPLNISNFRTYAEQILELPRRYPDIDFVFRPHPMLFDNLRKHKLWTEAQIQRYLDTIERTPNMTYSVEGDYMELFVNSDAMIHDCSSFIGEYLFTEHPCCYMFKPETKADEVYTPLGIKCLENYYPAHSWQDVTDFIDSVVLGGQDPMKAQREQFVRKTLKIGYPNGTKNVVSMILEAIENSK